MMKIAIASDHAGFALKKKIKDHLRKEGQDSQDFGAFSDESMDYPDTAMAVALAVSGGLFARAILVCGTGIGMSIAANKQKGIRAALCHNLFTAKCSREHNDANILCLGARVLEEDLALQMVDLWLITPFAGDRHQKRLDKIAAFEHKNC